MKVLKINNKAGSFVGWAEFAKPNKQPLTVQQSLGFVPQPNLQIRD